MKRNKKNGEVELPKLIDDQDEFKSLIEKAFRQLDSKNHIFKTCLEKMAVDDP